MSIKDITAGIEPDMDHLFYPENAGDPASIENSEKCERVDTSPDNMDRNHPKHREFQATLKPLRQRYSDELESVAKTGLPLKVEPHFESNFDPNWRSSVRVIYLDLTQSWFNGMLMRTTMNL